MWTLAARQLREIIYAFQGSAKTATLAHLFNLFLSDIEIFQTLHDHDNLH